MSRNHKLSFLTAVVLFFISGSTSLIYETVWIRILSLAVGSTAAAMGITLAIFFTGLGIGGALSGRLISSSKNFFKTYAVLEVIIGVASALALLVLLNLNSIVGWIQPNQYLDALIRYGIVTLALIVPTIAMGATLPALIAYFISQPYFKNANTSIVSFLYGLNTLGGAVGAILGSYLIITQGGLLTGTLVICLMNVILGVLAFAVSSAFVDQNSKKSAKNAQIALKSSAQSETLVSATALTKTHLYIIAVVSGFSSITAEVVWNKYLAIFFGTNIFGIGTILGIFLLGLAVGPLALTAISHRIRSLDNVLVITLFLAALTTSLTSFSLGYAPYVVEWLVKHSAFAAANSIACKGILAVLLIFPTASIYGVLFPLVAMQLTNAQRQNAAASAGNTYAINTAGSVAGSLVAGLWLVPLVGSYVTTSIAAALYAVAGFITFFAVYRRSTIKKIGYSAVLGAGIAASIVLLRFDFQAMIESARSYRASNIPLGKEQFKLILEGQNTVVSLSHDPLDGKTSRDYLRLKTSGLYESIFSMDGSRVLPRYEGLLGLLPWMVRSDAKDVFVVGFGAGYTVDLLTSLPIPHVKVVELESAIVDAFRFAVPNYNSFLGRKNLDLNIDDARHVLQRSPNQSFDIVVSQPSHSWLPGSANLFTEEYFELVHSKLRANGVFAQWLNLYNSNDDALKSILKSFFKTFPHGTVFTGEGDDELILLGSDVPLKMDSEYFNSFLAQQPELKQKLANLPMRQFNDIFNFYLADASAFTNELVSAPYNTDLNAYAEVIQSKQFYDAGNTIAQNKAKDFLTQHFDTRFQGLPNNFPRDSESQVVLLENYREQNQLQKLLKVLPPFLGPTNLSSGQKLRLANLLRSLEMNAHALAVSQEVLKQSPSKEAFETHIGILSDRGDFAQVAAVYNSFPKKYRSVAIDCYAANAFLKTGDRSSAATALTQKLVKEFDAYHGTCGSYSSQIYGKIYEKRNELARSLAFFDDYLRVYPRDVSALTDAITVSAKLKDEAKTSRYVGQWKTQAAAEQSRLNGLADMYKSAGFVEDAQAIYAVAQGIQKKTPAVD